MDDKNRVLVPFIVFNLVFAVYQYSFNWGDAFTWSKLLLAFGLGIAAAGAAFGAMLAMKK